jgi:hypothetical protein
VIARLRALAAPGWGRAALVAAGIFLLLALTGALATIFYRPYGHDIRAQLGLGHWGTRVALAEGFRVAHLVAAVAVMAALLVLVVLARPWKSPSQPPEGTPRRGALAALVLVGALFVVTGVVAPWHRLLPWSPAVGSNMARPMVLGQQGPFAELIGVNVRYDDALFTVARRRFGARATGRVYYAHVLVLPLLTAAGVILAFRRWRP